MSHIQSLIDNLSEEQARDAVAEAHSRSYVQKKLGLPLNGTGGRALTLILQRYQLKINSDLGKLNRRYERVLKTCPVCQKQFITSGKKQKETCSYACSNTHFRSGTNNGNYKLAKGYRTICWRWHDKKCVICNEQHVVEVHHYNENRKDNRPENLVPLCPTHHQYWHSKYRHLVQEKINSYVKNFQGVR